jgi:hypothetical protein
VGYCALHMNSGTRARAAAKIIRGQISISITRPSAGAEGAEEPGIGPGGFERHPDAASRPAAISGAKTRSASRRPAGVKCVTTTVSPRSSSARIRGTAERTSPKETAWTQTAPGQAAAR